MKKLFFTLAASFLLSTIAVAQEGTFKTIPNVQIKDLQGMSVNTETFLSNLEGPIVLSFWATWCKPCVTELNAIKDVYADWQEETGVKIIAISIDDARNAARVKPFANGQNWEYEIYIDENSDFKRALNVNNIPHTFLLNKKGEIVWQHTGYVPGDEDHLLEMIQQYAD